MGDLSVLVSPLLTGDAAWLREAERIYCESILEAERKPSSWLREAMARDDFLLLVAKADEKVCGMATVYRSKRETDLALLEYLAVDRGARGRGIGGILFQAAVEACGDRTMLIEVDAETGEGCTLQEQRQRMRFYRRLGCTPIRRVEYQLPLKTAGVIPPMELLIYPSRTVDRETLRRWISAVYVDVYGMGADDPRIEQMLAGLPVTGNH